MNGSGCKTCPVKPCHTLNYRGSYCAEQRAKFGLGDPQTNADRIRAMTDEELAWFLAEKYANEAVLRIRDSGHEPTATEIKAFTERLFYTWMRWLKQPVHSEVKEEYDIGKLYQSGILTEEELRNLMAFEIGG